MVAFGQDNTAASSAKSSVSSEKDLRKLRRIDLLELLIEQIRENDQQAQAIAELGGTVDDLKARLDEADARIGLLLQREVDHERHIEKLKQRNAALAHAAGLLDADEILRIADIAVDLYMGQLEGTDAGGAVGSVLANASGKNGFPAANDTAPIPAIESHMPDSAFEAASQADYQAQADMASLYDEPADQSIGYWGLG